MTTKQKTAIAIGASDHTKRAKVVKQLIAAAVTASLYCAAVSAAPVDEHVRGRILSVTPGTLTIRTASGASVSLALNGATHYLQVVRSSLDKIEPGSYIGTATKDTGAAQIALEVMIFPPTMQGLNAGHFPYDRLPDSTLSGGAATTTSMMTNGNVSAVTASPITTVSTTMTNGKISASGSQGGVKHLTVSYPGGRQTILVPPTAPIVNLLPGTISNLSKGAYVFVDAARNGGSLTAGLVAAGAGGLKPPF
ncbi:MAG TPA: hypothetical protein VGR92_17525 [Steroidobacteraceae bacterium]|nr:hypothetical protein [Steroidobacteraceae bacterium]